jgi:hypothetical protein
MSTHFRLTRTVNATAYGHSCENRKNKRLYALSALVTSDSLSMSKDKSFEKLGEIIELIYLRAFNESFDNFFISPPRQFFATGFPIFE